MLALAEIELTLDSLEARYSATMQEFKDKEIAQLKGQIAQGLDVRTVLAPTSSVFRYRRQAGMKLLETLDRAKLFGRGQVQQELGRQ